MVADRVFHLSLAGPINIPCYLEMIYICRTQPQKAKQLHILNKILPTEMNSWDEYNTREDIDPLEVSLQLQNQAYTDDQYNEQYKKETDVHMVVCSIEMVLGNLDFDMKNFQNVKNNHRPIDIDYCKSRYNANTSVLLKWRYCLALFIEEKGDWLKKTIPLILQSAKITDVVHSTIYLTLAFNLNKLHTCRQDDEINKCAIYLLKHKSGIRFPGACVGIIGELEKSPEKKEEAFNIIMTLLPTQEEHIREDSLKNAIKVAKDKNQARARLAKHYEDSGDEKTDKMTKVYYYRLALKPTLNQSDKDRIANKIKDASQSIQFNTIESTYELKKKLPIPGNNGFERLQSLIWLFKRHVPKIDDVKQEASELKQKHPLSHAFPTIDFDYSGMPASTNLSEEEKAYVGQYTSNIRLYEVLLSASVSEYENAGKITVQNHENYLDCFGFHDKSTLGLITHGIARHYEKDYISSIHILIPQVENTLRNLLAQKGINTISTARDLEFSMLGNLISKSSAILGDNIAEFLKLKFVNRTSLNLRNLICHSLLANFDNTQQYDPRHFFSHSTSLSLILVIELLTQFSIEMK